MNFKRKSNLKNYKISQIDRFWNKVIAKRTPYSFNPTYFYSQLISRHMYSKILINLILSIFLHSGPTQFSRLNPEKPNVLILYMDDLRPELGSYGKDYMRTPNIDKLSAEGVQFNRAYCNVPVCGASRASMLTGMYPNTKRFLNYDTFVEKETPDAVTLPQLFKNNGYKTISNGKVYHHLDDRENDWDEIWRPYAFEPNEKGLAPTDYWQSLWKDYLKPENAEVYKTTGNGPAYEKAEVPDSAYIDGLLTEKTIRDLKQLAKNKEKPFFMAAGFISPHLPFNAPSKHWEKYQREEIEQPGNNFEPVDAPLISISNWPEMRSYSNIPKNGNVSDSLAIDLIHGYRATVSYVDALIGNIMNTLEETGLKENTIVVLVADHGYHLQENAQWAKFTNYHISTRVPLIIKAPGFSKNFKTEALTDLVDIYPTLAEICGLKPPKDQLDGRSLFPNLKNRGLAGKSSVFIKRGNGFTLQTTDFSFTQYRNIESGRVIAEMLYDHRIDPGETTNLIHTNHYKNIAEALRAELLNNYADQINP